MLVEFQAASTPASAAGSWLRVHIAVSGRPGRLDNVLLLEDAAISPDWLGSAKTRSHSATVKSDEPIAVVQMV